MFVPLKVKVKLKGTENQIYDAYLIIDVPEEKIFSEVDEIKDIKEV